MLFYQAALSGAVRSLILCEVDCYEFSQVICYCYYYDGDCEMFCDCFDGVFVSLFCEEVVEDDD